MSDDNIIRPRFGAAPRAVATPPVHEVLLGIADELEAMATGPAPKPAELHALAERVDQLAERALQESRASSGEKDR